MVHCFLDFAESSKKTFEREKNGKERERESVCVCV